MVKIIQCVAFDKKKVKDDLRPQVTQVPVTIEEGAPPSWLSGTLARHACGVYGETGGV